MSIELPIDPERLEKRSLSNRFWGSEPRHNYFARAKNLVLRGGIDQESLRQIKDEYDGDLARDFSHQWGELLEEISYWIALDGRVDADEREFFRAYIDEFAISKEMAAKL